MNTETSGDVERKISRQLSVVFFFHEKAKKFTLHNYTYTRRLSLTLIKLDSFEFLCFINNTNHFFYTKDKYIDHISIKQSLFKSYGT